MLVDERVDSWVEHEQGYTSLMEASNGDGALMRRIFESGHITAEYVMRVHVCPFALHRKSITCTLWHCIERLEKLHWGTPSSEQMTLCCRRLWIACSPSLARRSGARYWTLRCGVFCVCTHSLCTRIVSVH